VGITEDNPMGNKRSRGPLSVAVAVAAFGLLALLIVDHGPWNKPEVESAEIGRYKTTGAAAAAVGAKVTPTEPKSVVEPEAPGPKPAQPASPVIEK
jgi:hypothetical protein